jgi:hypothetical protein
MESHPSERLIDSCTKAAQRMTSQIAKLRNAAVSISQAFKTKPVSTGRPIGTHTKTQKHFAKKTRQQQQQQQHRRYNSMCANYTATKTES